MLRLLIFHGYEEQVFAGLEDEARLGCDPKKISWYAAQESAVKARWLTLVPSEGKYYMLSFLFGRTRSFSTPVFANWHTLVEDFQTSPLEFYEAVEAAVRKREIPDLRFSRVEYHESGVLSALRIYQRIERKKLAFDVCAAPFGTGFFFSWWLSEPKKSYKALGCLAFLLFLAFAYIVLDKYGTSGCFFALFGGLVAGAVLVMGVREGWFLSEDIIRDTPYIGAIYEHFFDPETFYKEDTRTMYREMVHAAVLEVVDGTLEAKGLRALAPEYRKPEIRRLAG